MAGFSFFFLSRPDGAAGACPFFVGVKLTLDRSAFALPIVDGQRNLAAQARLSPSSVRDDDQERCGAQNLFDNNGHTVWDTEPTDPVSAVEMDFGEAQWISSAAIAQHSVAFDPE